MAKILQRFEIANTFAKKNYIKNKLFFDKYLVDP